MSHFVSRFQCICQSLCKQEASDLPMIVFCCVLVALNRRIKGAFSLIFYPQTLIFPMLFLIMLFLVWNQKATMLLASFLPAPSK